MAGGSPAAADTALTSRRVLAIAGPIVLSNATIPLIGAVDTAVVGRLGAAAIGAVGLGAIILASAYWIFGFLRMGTSGLVAQARGAGDPGAEGAHLVRALAIGLAAGLGLIALYPALIAGAFALAPASAEVEAGARAYISIRIWGAPATIAQYALTGWLIAAERARGVLAVQLLTNGVNIALDLLFVPVLGWGVPGVAAASLLGEAAGLALALWLARGMIRHGLAQAGLWHRADLTHLARVNGDIALRSVLLQGAFTSFVFLGAGLGDVTLAVNQVLIQFLEITAYALDGFAFAAESLVGQAMGARRPDLLRRAAILTSAWGAAGALSLAALFAVGGGAMIDAITTLPELRDSARLYLPWLVAAPVIGIASWMLDGIFMGATRTRDMRNAMLLSVAIYVPALILLPMLWGNHGMWAALMVLNLARGVTMARRYPALEAAARPRPLG